MGLKVGGFGVTRAEIANALEPIEQQLRLLADTPLTAGDVPGKKKEIRQRATVLDRQIEILNSHVKSPDPKIRDSALALLEVAKRERLKLEDGLLAWVVDDMSRGRSTAAERGGEPSLTIPELSAVTALIGGLVTDAELHHAMEVLAPLAGQNLTDEHFQPKLDVTDQHFDRIRKKTNPAALKVAGLRVGPTMGGFLATSAVRSLGGPPALAFMTAILAIRLGITAGRHLANEEIQRVRLEHGMNRLEGEVDHDLARIEERAKKGLPFAKQTGEVLLSSAREEADLVRYLVDRRKETFEGREVSGREQTAIGAFEAYAGALEKADSDAAVHAARKTLTGATKGLQLASLPSLPELAPIVVDEQRTGAAFAEMAAHYGSLLLSASNPPLARLVQQLEARAEAPSPGQLAYLQTLVGPEPSIGEILGLSRLFAAGKVDVGSLWSGDAAVQLPDGRPMEQTTVRQLMDGLGDREGAARWTFWAKMSHTLAPFVSAVVGTGALFLTGAGAPGLMEYGGALAGTMLAEKAGTLVGAHLARRGTAERTNAGVELTPALGREYAVAFERLMRPHGLTAGSGEALSASLVREAGMLEAMVASVGTGHAALAAQRANMPDGAPEADVLDHALALIEDIEKPIYATLSAAAERLRELGSARGLSDEAKRGAVAELRDQLLGLLPHVTLDVLIGQAEPELSMAHGYYFRAKRDLAEALKAGADKAELTPLVALFNATVDTIPRKQRPEGDGLDKWAKKVKDDAKQLDQRADVTKLVTPSYLEKLEETRADTLSIKDKRAKAVGQELMNALWTQVWGRFGLTSGDVPELSTSRIERLPIPEAEGFSNLKLTGKIQGGGKFELMIDALGQPSTDLSTMKLDLGEKTLGRFVASAAAQHLEVASGAAPEIRDVQLLERKDEAYRFTVRVGERRMIATISPDGILQPGWLSA